jgi:cyclophilin family peptidyl-prolyl cis-trans isomerase
VRFIAAHYLGRTRDIDLTPYAAQLTHALHSETDPFTRIALVLALGKAVQSGVLQVLTALLTDAGEDYRIKVNSLRALARFNYNDINDLFLSMVSHDNVNIAVTAAEYFLANGRETDAGKYWETARNLSNWRPRALMLAAALKSTPAKKEKEKISARIRTIYQKSGNNYEKAFLLKALAGDPGNYPLLEQETFAHVGKEAVISSYGIEALVEMSRSVKNDKGLLKIFAAIFQKAVESGDPALILSAAAVLRDPDMNFKDIYTHFDFLTTAMAHCKLPQDLEGWLELRKTRDFFKGTPTAAPAPPLKNHPLDWKLVTSIPANQRVRVKTTKGDIILQLKVNEAPGSVSTFVGLIKANFYQTSVFHRVVPNFVIQDGCPRGDGVGGPAFTIGSELGPLYYEEGSVGMASVGKDTEGSQWFITHAPTPHLDGRYSIFASVVAGMEVVHQIEIGDRVLGFEWISSP